MQQFVYIFLAFQLIWLFYLVPYVIPRYTNFMLDTFKWYPVYIPLAILIYWLGIKGYLISYQQGIPKKVGSVPASLSSTSIDETVQATFQRTFKELTGMSPSEYRKLAPLKKI